MTMTERLEALQRESSSRLPPETLAVVHRAVEDLRRSGAAERAKKVGDRAPGFALANAEGRTVRSADLLARGPLVVSFYRGNW